MNGAGRTPVGKFLAKLRIDRGETMDGMAERLGVTKAYLSAVETGTREVPTHWVGDVCVEYGLEGKDADEFTRAVAETATVAQIDLDGFSPDERELIVRFARFMYASPALDADRIKRIENIMEEEK